MNPTDTSEHPPVAPNTVQEPVSVYRPGGYVLGRASDYNRDMALDVAKLLPAPGNAAASEAFAKNIFSVTRQVRYSTLMRNTRCGARSPSPPAPRRNDTKRCERPRPTRPPGAEYFFVIRVM